MELYAGLDLHSRSIYIGIMDNAFNRVFKKRVPNHLELILHGINFLKQKIKQLEKAIIQKVKLNKEFKYLLTVPGIGNILAMTIMLEVGNIKRFPKVGNFTSYCRCVPSRRLSDGKSKGQGNRKKR